MDIVTLALAKQIASGGGGGGGSSTPTFVATTSSTIPYAPSSPISFTFNKTSNEILALLSSSPTNSLSGVFYASVFASSMG